MGKKLLTIAAILLLTVHVATGAISMGVKEGDSQTC
jgi:hypothetical protein